MLYSLLKVIFKTALHVFFRRIEVRNQELLPEKGPLIVVSNHPNTMMDPIAIGAVMRQELFFIAKSTLFGSPFRTWLLGKMNMIPIYRQEDAAGKPASNEETFRKCYQYLERGLTLLIFPEGTSFNERRLRPLKTGTARMALGAEACQDYEMGLMILPIGLNYTDPTRFRSDLFINIGSPIAVAPFAEAYQDNPVKAVQSLTDLIRARLEELVIHTATDEEDELVHQVERIYKNQLLTEFNLSPQRKEDSFLLTKGIVESIGFFREKQPERVRQLRQHIEAYQADLEKLRLRDELLHPKGPGKSLLKDGLLNLLLLLIGFPLYLYGLLHNYLPYKIPAVVADALTEEEEFVAPIMMTTGIFTFPVFYGMSLFGASYVLSSGVLLLFYAVSLPLSGFFTLRYWHWLRQTGGYLTLFSLFYGRSSLLGSLLHQRLAIIKQLEEAKADYLAAKETPNNLTSDHPQHRPAN